MHSDKVAAGTAATDKKMAGPIPKLPACACTSGCLPYACHALPSGAVRALQLVSRFKAPVDNRGAKERGS